MRWDETIITFKELGSYGRLANQLFQIASTIGIATRNNQQYIFPKWSYSKFFKNPIPQIEKHELDKIDFKLYSEKHFHFADTTLEGDWNLFGYFQSEKYFKHCEEFIRSYFEFKEDYTRYLEEKYGKYLDGKTCSLHVRRGDYIKQRDCYLCPVEYYRKAFHEFDGDTVFLVFSDDLNWCKQVFVWDHFVFVEGEPDIMDLYLMSMCKNNIIANSSFSWWGAWLNKNERKKVIAPSQWLGWTLSNIKTKDLIPNNWIKIKLRENISFEVGSALVKFGNPIIPKLLKYIQRLENRKKL